MHWTEPATAADSHAALEKKLRDAANRLCAGADLKPSDWRGATKTTRQGSPKGERGGAHQYSSTVLGLIFLRYADVRFSAVEKDLKPQAVSRRKIRIDAYQVQSTGITNFKFAPFLKEEMILVPPRDLQTKWQATADNLLNEASLLRAKNQTLRRTRDLLLPKLLSPAKEEI